MTDDPQGEVEMTEVELLKSFDGVVWAAEFRRIAKKLYSVDLDDGWLAGWFCNALMRGYDEHARRASRSAGAGEIEAATLNALDVLRKVAAARRNIGPLATAAQQAAWQLSSALTAPAPGVQTEGGRNERSGRRNILALGA